MGCREEVFGLGFKVYGLRSRIWGVGLGFRAEA